MSWNYRVIRIEEAGEPCYSIHECHYANKGDTIPTSWTEEPSDVSSDTRVGLFFVLAIMTEAVAQPVLEERGGKLFEVEPEQQLSDDLKKAVAANKEYSEGMA